MPLTYSYKGFTLIDPSYEPTDVETEPWGTIEDSHHTDIIDWIGADCYSTSFSASGHKHTKVYNGYGYKAFDANNQGDTVTVGYCGDGYAARQIINAVIGSTLSSFIVKDKDGLEFLNIKSNDQQAITFGRSTYNVTISGDVLFSNEVTLSDDTQCIGALEVDGLLTCITGASITGGAVTVGDATHDVTLDAVQSLTVEGTTGEVFSRREIALAHTTEGMTSLSDDDVEIASMVGGRVDMRINIAGTGSELYRRIVVPFSVYSADSGTGGCVLGLIKGQNNGVTTMVEARYELNGSDKVISFAPYDGTYTSWETYGASSLSGRLSFTINEPNFTNSVA